jgi:hypothetical protein
MKQVTISFTVKEYKELAKLVYLGSHFLWGADDYKNTEVAEKILLEICTVGYEEVPECGAFQTGGIGTSVYKEPEFVISNELAYECDDLEEAYMKRAFLEFLSCQMSERDFYEKFGEMEIDEVTSNPKLMRFLTDKQTEYRQELMFNGIENLHVVKK